VKKLGMDIPNHTGLYKKNTWWETQSFTKYFA